MPHRRLALSLLLFLIVPVPWVEPSAQDASTVLQLNIAYRTARNSTTPSVELARQLDQLEMEARNATSDGQYGEAHRHLSHALALLSGREWSAFRELGAALKVTADRVILEPGQAIEVTLSRIFVPTRPLPQRLTGTIAIGETVNGRYRTVRELAQLDDDPAWLANGRRVTMTVPELPDGEYVLAVSYLPAGGEQESIFKPLRIAIARGIYRRSQKLANRLAELRRRDSWTEKPELLSGLAEIEYTIDLLRLLNSGTIPVERQHPAAALERAAEMLESIARGENPLTRQRGDLHLAYRSEVDGTLQPYRIFVPSTYQQKSNGRPPHQNDQRWPLAIALHGWGGDENSLFEGRQNGELKRIAEAHGYLIACPKGRGPTSLYLGNAEKDVLEVLRQMERDYRIDPDRIYLLGHSMGGYGTWSIAANHPEIFAALAPVSGLGSILITARLKNIRHIPWLVTHGVRDRTVPIEESRRMVAAGRRLGIEIRFDEIAEGDHFNVFGPALKEIFAWFDTHSRQKH
ncbi:MAG: hypothetical protein RIR86_599 [Acidobacteriota bacterium]|jgi:predicted esterase